MQFALSKKFTTSNLKGFKALYWANAQLFRGPTTNLVNRYHSPLEKRVKNRQWSP